MSLRQMEVGGLFSMMMGVGLHGRRGIFSGTRNILGHNLKLMARELTKVLKTKIKLLKVCQYVNMFFKFFKVILIASYPFIVKTKMIRAFSQIIIIVTQSMKRYQVLVVELELVLYTKMITEHIKKNF